YRGRGRRRGRERVGNQKLGGESGVYYTVLGRSIELLKFAERSIDNESLLCSATGSLPPHYAGPGVAATNAHSFRPQSVAPSITDSFRAQSTAHTHSSAAAGCGESHR